MKGWNGYRVALVILAAVALVLTGSGLYRRTHPHGSEGVNDQVVIVSCPSEDSCTVDYYDGAWHIGPPGSAQ